jgi:hypothetical protein
MASQSGYTGVQPRRAFALQRLLLAALCAALALNGESGRFSFPPASDNIPLQNR